MLDTPDVFVATQQPFDFLILSQYLIPVWFNPSEVLKDLRVYKCQLLASRVPLESN